ncbi:hypothetical protein B5F96_17700 [Parabacteroides johnsonii]|uniref:Uncharacterized protein n=1 Tax=Parabacteroides johnsonii TaxID=387661 RepID=A0A9Q5SMX3_9BACT|nr:hypothetical protein B5F96_17700 [Parabacteroides johnsonii]
MPHNKLVVIETNQPPSLSGNRKEMPQQISAMKGVTFIQNKKVSLLLLISSLCFGKIIAVP